MATENHYTRRIQDAGEPDFFTDYIAWKRVAEIERFVMQGRPPNWPLR